jgi:F-type H+-transporting ATPase subunit epsilon
MFQLFIADPEQVVFEGDVKSVNAPGTEGYLEILSHHAALLTALQEGKVTVTYGNGDKSTWDISGGFLEVFNNKVTLLADVLEIT